MYEEGDDGEEVDEGVGEDATEEEEQDEEEEKEKDGEGDAVQTKERLLPERRSRRLRSEVNKEKKCVVQKCVMKNFKTSLLV